MSEVLILSRQDIERLRNVDPELAARSFRYTATKYEMRDLRVEDIYFKSTVVAAQEDSK